MEIHGAPGAPRTAILLSAGRRLAVLEVTPGRDRGAVHQVDGTPWTFQRPPGGSEWWIFDDADTALGTVARLAPVRERFALEIAGCSVDVVPVSKPWRRLWRVVDERGRDLLEVVQRPYARTVHDLTRRSGDVPRELPLAVAWTVALATSPRMPDVRGPRWTLR